MIVVCAFCFGEFEFIFETRDPEKKKEVILRGVWSMSSILAAATSSFAPPVLPPRERW